MILSPIIAFLGSQLFGNIILLVTVVVAFAIGYQQIYLSDVVEIYATANIKQKVNVNNGTTSSVPVISIQNVGTRVVYLDRYIFNGSEYITNGQILPPTYSQSNALYWIDLPTNGQTHVSLVLYYHDLNGRKWTSSITADFKDNSWDVRSLPRIGQ